MRHYSVLFPCESCFTFVSVTNNIILWDYYIKDLLLDFIVTIATRWFMASIRLSV